MTGELLGGSGELSKGLSLDGSCKHCYVYVSVCVCVLLSDIMNDFCTLPLLLWLPGCIHTLLY